MKPGLAEWIGSADVARYSANFEIQQVELAPAITRPEEYYISLVSAIFSAMRSSETEPREWATLGNALGMLANTVASNNETRGIATSEAALFAALAFYAGGFPASAALIIKPFRDFAASDKQAACIDLVTKRPDLRSERVRALVNAMITGEAHAIAAAAQAAADDVAHSVELGPDDWIFARAYQEMIERFCERNLRAVLPNGYSRFWDVLVRSFADASPPVLEFFPSQIDAIRKGILEPSHSYAVQMPTGAGKTALSETLIYANAKARNDAIAVLLVPFRAIASELKATMVRRLNSMGVMSRSEYGGTVPPAGEIIALEQTQAIIATPEALSGILNAAPEILERITLVICDEGHLLAAKERGVALELLLTRLTLKQPPTRFVFVSAIIPNLEEINAWLGGNDDTVVRSDYRPTSLEFAVLRPSASGRSYHVGLELHGRDAEPVLLSPFLASASFRYLNAETNRPNTYPFRSAKTQAVAAARKALTMGPVALFARNKRGNQGAIGLAEELLNQLKYNIALPRPEGPDGGRGAREIAAYLEMNFGREWVGTRIMRQGAILHHGDVPQETREVLEFALRQGHARLAICTSTLAEGVNLPFRTLVLYSLRQFNPGSNESQAMLSRDIKNLVGRAGRAGATTGGLVICANPQEWAMVSRVMRQAPGENIVSALGTLIRELRSRLSVSRIILSALTNENLEATPDLFPLVDGIDASLIDLAVEEVGEEQLIDIARTLASKTFAATAQPESSNAVLVKLFQLRAARIAGLRASGRLEWIRQTGARARMIGVVEALANADFGWEDVEEPTDPQFVDIVLNWAWDQRELAKKILAMDLVPGDQARSMLSKVVKNWLAGETYNVIARDAHLNINDALRLLAGGVSFDLQTMVEQGMALLSKFLEEHGREMSGAAAAFPIHLRYGVPSAQSRALCELGVGHRSAAVKLGCAPQMQDVVADDSISVLGTALGVLTDEASYWQEALGALVYRNTLRDLGAAIGGRGR